jgi:ankyrin repeat protein
LTDGRTPLYAACFFGHLAVVQLLVEAGADKDKPSKSSGYTPLIAACKRGHFEVVGLLVKAGADKEKSATNGSTPLSVACHNGDVEVVGLLVEDGADKEKATTSGFTPLLIACRNGHVEVVRVLVEAKAGADKEKATTSGYTPLLIACSNGHVEVVQLLVEAGADTKKVTANGCTLLLAASLSGHIEVVRMLLKAGADTEKSKTNGTTPLLIACQNDHIDVVQLLLKAGADKEKAATNGPLKGYTPLLIACRNGHVEVVRLLVEAKAGADKEKANPMNGFTPFYAACRNGHVEVVQLLVEDGADKEKATTSGFTPLLIACRNGHVEVVRVLLEAKAGADKEKASTDGYTPLLIACHNGHVEVARVLVEAGADKDSAANNGGTPLLAACEKGRIEVVRLLVEAGADKEKASTAGYTPLLIACENGHVEVVRVLVEAEAGADKEKALGDEIYTAFSMRYTPLLIACHNGHVEVVRLLVEAGADTEKSYTYGYTPLFAACAKGEQEIVRLLIEASADKNMAPDQKQCWLRGVRQTMRTADSSRDARPLVITTSRLGLLSGLCELSTGDFTQGIDVRFDGENAVGDGVRREYFGLVAREFINPMCNLLQTKATEGDQAQAHRLQPSDSSDVNPDHLSYFEMLGKLIGLALLHGEILPLRLTIPFLKQLLQLELEPEDLRLVDPVLYEHKVVRLLQYSEEQIAALDLCFEEEKNHFGASNVVQLLKAGTSEPYNANEAVTIGNREEYTAVLCHYLLTSKIQEQTAAVRRGLAVVIPEPLMGAMGLCISAEELDVMVAGNLTLSIDEWQLHTQYKGGYTADSEQVVWFWELLRNSVIVDADDPQRLLVQTLAFVTGSEAVGPGGFEALQGYGGGFEDQVHKFTIKCDVDASLDGLPKSQTCFNTLLLPPYSIREVLERKLSLAVSGAAAAFDEGAVAN